MTKKPGSFKKLILRILLYAVIFVVCIITLYPYFAMFCTALKSRAEIFSMEGTILPITSLWSNFLDIWHRAEDAFAVVRRRGIYMQEAVPEGGAMSAVLGMESTVVEEVCSRTPGLVTVANYNCPGQIVITGEKDAVDRAGETLKERGAKRIIPLNVSGPFHSQMLISAGERLLKDLERVRIQDPKIPYVANLTADYVNAKEEVRYLLKQQISSPVKWQQSVERMIGDGVTAFVEIGPGKTLSGFVKKIDRKMTVINVDHYEDLLACMEVLANA